MKKSITTLLLVASLLINSLALAEIPPTFHEDGYPIVDDPITLKIGICQRAHENDHSQSEIFQKLQDKMGIKLEFVTIPQSNFAETFNLLMTGDDYPDIWYGRGTAGMDLTTYVNSGMLLGLTGLINQYAPNVKKMMDTESYAWQKFEINDELYGIPWLYTQLEELTEDKWYINQEWLDTLNLEMPTTPMELRTVLEAFRDNDCNGNGDPNDEIPMSVWAGYYGMGSLYGPWGVVDNQNNHMMVKDGQLLFVPASEGYRKGLAYWRDMYKDKLLWDQSFTIGFQEYHAMSKGEDMLFGSFIRHIGGSVVGDENIFEYSYMEPLKSEEGTQLWKTTDTPYNASNCFLITDKCQYPEVAIRLADYFCTEQGTLEFRYGPENYTWHWNDDGTWSMSLENLPEGVALNTLSPTGFAFGWCSEELMRKQKFPDQEKLDARLYNHYLSADKRYQPYRLSEYVPNNLPFTPAEREELSYVWGTLNDYVKNMEASFIIGEKDLATWDEYMSTLKDMGLERVMTIYQGAYNRMLGK